MGGQVLSGGTASGSGCPLQAPAGVGERLVQHLKPAVRSRSNVAQRVALAVLGAVLHRNCS